MVGGPALRHQGNMHGHLQPELLGPGSWAHVRTGAALCERFKFPICFVQCSEPLGRPFLPKPVGRGASIVFPNPIYPIILLPGSLSKFAHSQTLPPFCGYHRHQEGVFSPAYCSQQRWRCFPLLSKIFCFIQLLAHPISHLDPCLSPGLRGQDYLS